MKNLLMLLLMSVALATPPRNKTTVWAVDVDSDALLSAPLIEGHVGDTVKWRSLERVDNIARLPASFDILTDPCTAPQAVVDDVTDEFTGPSHLGVPGVFVRGPSEDTTGPEIIDYSGCNLSDPTPAGNPGCCDNDNDPVTEGTRAYCAQQDLLPRYLPDEMWDYTWLGGELLIVDWDATETADGVYDWSLIDHEFQRAAEAGKFIQMSFRTDNSGTPSWLFDPPLNATEITLKGTNDNDFDPFNNCGSVITVGSPFDTVYVSEINELMTDFFARINAHPAWRQALAGWQLMGVNASTDEFKTFNTCPDAFVNSGNGHTTAGHDGFLDSYNGSDCACNSKTWAEAGWNAESIADFVANQSALVHTLAGDDVIVRYGLIQGGLVKTKSSTNYTGDSLRDQSNVCLTDPDADNDCTENTADDGQQVGSADQVDRIIEHGKDAAANRNEFWAMHFGIGRYPTEDESNPAATNCSFGGVVDLINELINYPIPLVGPVGSEPQCPNKWANNTTITPPAAEMSGFQTNNAGNGIDDPVDIESVLLNLERNTNALYLEIYASTGFKVNERVGSTNDIDPTRDDMPTPAGIDAEVGYTKSMGAHVQELIDRRDGGTFAEPDVFPTTWEHTFTVPGTYYYYVPRRCPAVGDAQYGTIIIH